MLHINNLTFRIEGRPILDGATAAIPSGHKVGLVGRNGAGKTTLLRLITGELAADDGSITVGRNMSIGHVAQEAPGGDESLIEWVLGTHAERASLLAAAETESDPYRIAEIQTRLADIGAYAAPARVSAILAGLGFDEAARAQPCRTFSGGWRMRLALGSVLFQEPEILLLDEPTNYLDLEGTLWLENYLRSYPHTIIIVSHDRDLLNNTVGSILSLERGKLSLYTGGYDAFEEARRERQRLDLKLRKKQDDARRHMEAFVERFRAKASKAAQAQSRLKALARMQPIAEAVEDRVAPFVFPTPAKKLADPLLTLEGVSAGYQPGSPVLSGLDLRLDQADRIALLGQNGNGKSTFAKLLSGKLPAQSGRIGGMHRLTVGYFAQHQLDELDPSATPYDYIVSLLPEATEAQRRARLGAAGFGVEKAGTKCDQLSGGEKARLMLFLTAFHAPHLLILDEPTNHLDIDSREALVHAVNEYEGAVMVISHDRHFVNAVADRLWLVRGGTVKPYSGDIDLYRAETIAERTEKSAESGAANGKNNGPTTRAEGRRLAALRRAELQPLKRAVEAAEKRLALCSDKLKSLDSRLADPDVYANAAEATKLMLERGQVSRELSSAEDAWLHAVEAYDTAAQALDP